jgi:hypothetical protein
MSRDTLPNSLIESLIFWTEDDLPEDYAEEILKVNETETVGGEVRDEAEVGLREEGTSKGKGKGKAKERIERAEERRQSMYVGLFEGELIFCLLGRVCR